MEDVKQYDFSKFFKYGWSPIYAIMILKANSIWRVKMIELLRTEFKLPF